MNRSALTELARASSTLRHECGIDGAPDEDDLALGPCPCVLSLMERGWLAVKEVPMPALDDEEGERVDPSLPRVVDAHVHLFPDKLLDAIWRWFEAYGWPIRYRLHTPEIVRFLLGRGVDRVVGLAYAHKPGMARALNGFMADVMREEPRVIGLATVLPGEPDARAILEEAFAMGLRGVKLHCHVQAFAPDAPELEAIYEVCVAHDRPVVMHAGREPASPHYPRDPYALCGAQRIEHVLRQHPRLRLSVPHFGADEVDAYVDLLTRYDHLWVDTTMVFADYFPVRPDPKILTVRPERVLFGTDFPNLPYAWDRELRRLTRMGVGDADLEQILSKTADALFAP
jgi:predicted TIM-barrel fold metal-dependent hydrolase